MFGWNIHIECLFIYMFYVCNIFVSNFDKINFFRVLCFASMNAKHPIGWKKIPLKLMYGKISEWLHILFYITFDIRRNIQMNILLKFAKKNTSIFEMFRKSWVFAMELVEYSEIWNSNVL